MLQMIDRPFTVSIFGHRYVENFSEIECKIEKILSEPEVEFSDRFKKRMNRLFREKVGTKRAMYPEVDNCFERTRSHIVRAKLVAVGKVKRVMKIGNPT